MSRRIGVLELIFGQSGRARAGRDQYRLSTIGKNLISPINSYGTCFACDGAGTRTLECRECAATGKRGGECRTCHGAGQFERPRLDCYPCSGIGFLANGRECRRCGGTGTYRPAQTAACAKCRGEGRFEAECRKCGGKGRFTVECRKCRGTGWHRF